MPSFSDDDAAAGGWIVYLLAMLYMFLALAIVCDEYFVPALDEVVEYLNVSPDVAGATFMAAGGSMPELATSAIGTFTGSNVGFGTVVGSAVFNVLFVIGCCAIFSKETLSLTWWPLFRDCTYYCLSLLVLAAFFGYTSCQLIYWGEALGLLLLYVGYCVVMKFNAELQTLVTRLCAGRAAASKVHVVTHGAAAAATSATTSGAAASGQPAAAPAVKAQLSRGYTGMLRVDAVEQAGRGGTGRVRLRASVLHAFLDESPMLSSASMLTMRQEKADLRALFDRIDQDGSGAIDRSEVAALLGQLWNRPVEEGEVDDSTLKALDANGDGRVCFGEFAQWYVQSDQKLQAELDAKFDALDADRSGSLTAAELRPLLGSLDGVDMADEAIAAALEEVESLTNSKNDGAIDKVEFSAWFKASLFFEQQKAAAEKAAAADAAPSLAMPAGGLRVKLCWAIALPIVASLKYTVPDMRVRAHRPYFVLAFALSIVWIGAYSFVMVWAAESFGVVMQIPSAVMGLTFLAAGTSIPDLLTSVLVARKGEGDMAVSSSIGSNIFDVLVGLPLPWLLYALVHQRAVVVAADSLVTSVMVLFLMLSSVILTIAASGWKMTRGLGGVMFSLYGVFVVQDLLVQFCVIELPTLPCE